MNSVLRHRDLWLILLVAGLALLVHSLSSFPPLRAIANIPLLFFAPGYVLLTALTHRVWDWPSALAASVGLSLSLLVIVGLVFQLLGLPIQSSAWWAWLIAHGVVCISVTLWRRAGQTGDTAPQDSWLARPRLFHIVPVALAILIILASWVFGTVGQLVQHQQTFTQLWMIPCQDEAACDLQIGVRNYEWRPKEFRLELLAQTRVLESWVMTMNHDETWTADVRLPDDLGLGVTLMARLYRTEEPGITYRFTTLRPTALNP